MKIHSGLAKGQVLQRIGRGGASAQVSGTCQAEGPITATISAGGRALKGWNKRVAGRSSRGKFKAELSEIPAGGPYDLTLQNGKETAQISSFFVGDVWIMAGQSNMEGVGLISGKAKPHPLVRAFSMRRVWRLATDPLHILIESPDWCHHESVQYTEEEGEKKRRRSIKGTGLGVFFGREMLARSGVPQGLICTAHGGTTMQQWSPERKKLGGESLYASMLASVQATGQPVAGVLWYQGESDATLNDVPLYTARMMELVTATRRDLKQRNLPWIIVQLAKVMGQTDSLAPWNEIQEQQRLMPQRIHHFETVAAVDLPLDDGIHIGADGYPLLAQRMARMADRLVYGNRRELPPPQPLLLRRVGRPEDAVVEATFDHVVGGLRSVGPAYGFVFVTSEGKPLPVIYRTVLRGNVARLLLNGPLPEGTRLTYGCGTSPICNITDGRGFSLPVFGPLDLRYAKKAVLPFVTEWQVSGVIAGEKSLAEVQVPQMEKLETKTKKYGSDGFINEHDFWIGRKGLCFFQAGISLEEPMVLRFLMGYDGPFRLWLDGKPFFADLEGVNPCLPDKGAKVVALKRGVHDVRIGMDAAYGRSWGFFLRFQRQDIEAKQRESGDYPKPVYLPAAKA